MGPVLHQVMNESFVFVHAYDQYLDVRIITADDLCGFDPILSGHLKVHQYDLYRLGGKRVE